MALYIDVTGTPDSVFADLYAIAHSDGGLGEVGVPDPTVNQVTYTPTLSGTTVTRLKAVVDHPSTIVITGLPSGATGPDGNPITGNGLTYVDGAGVIRIAYDTGQCNGNGIWTVGEDGSHISTPGPVVLYHEMSHAWHYATGTIAATPALEEVAAETDENDMRDVVGLPHRKVTDHTGGCGGVAPGGGCFIVTAAYGSTARARVERLRSLRDGVLKPHPVGLAAFDELHREYYRFSPAVAARMDRDEDFRATVRDLLVEPLTAFFELAAARVFTPEGLPGARLRLEEIARGHHTGDAAELARSLSEPAGGGPSVLGISVPGESPLVQWALIGPLALYWQSVARGLSPGCVVEVMERYVPVWGAGLPCPPGVTQAERDTALKSLKEALDA
ncbi:CFI-box-CTERM domain-containing protein [Streptomyces sioyaensis]|uniref:CFI-box-CTERM domain-containing protein n=1 Tax=Streptomyces sioyaensis TaxID=67364 RepID=UPI0037CDF85D